VFCRSASSPSLSPSLGRGLPASGGAEGDQGRGEGVPSNVNGVIALVSVVKSKQLRDKKGDLGHIGDQEENPTSTRTKGHICLVIRHMSIPVIAVTVKRLPPTGGVISPMLRFTHIKIPK